MLENEFGRWRKQKSQKNAGFDASFECRVRAGFTGGAMFGLSMFCNSIKTIQSKFFLHTLP